MLRKNTAIIFVLSIAIALGCGAFVSANAAGCTAAEGQALINQGQYDQAVQKFTCVIAMGPTEVEGYRGRIEAEVLLGRYSDAVRDYQRVNAYVVPIHPDAKNIILDGYMARLGADPDNIIVLTGLSFARWWFFDYANALHYLDRLLALEPNSVYGNLFRGSSRLLSHSNTARGHADLEFALLMQPQNPHIHFIVADAYTYGAHDPQRAFDEATTALNGGLDTPRIHAILAVSYQAFGDEAASAAEIKMHNDLVTTDLVTTAPLAAGSSFTGSLVPGRTFEIPIPVVAGQTISIATSSRDFWDTIAVLLAPDGTPIVGSDDFKKYFAGFEYVAPATGTFRLQVTSFESVSTGELLVTRN